MRHAASAYGNINAFPDDGVEVAAVGGQVYRGAELPQLSGRYVFGDGNTSFGQPDGTLLVTKERPEGLRQLQELRVLTSDATGPTGTTGLVYRLTKPSG